MMQVLEPSFRGGSLSSLVLRCLRPQIARNPEPWAQPVTCLVLLLASKSSMTQSSFVHHQNSFQQKDLVATLGLYCHAERWRHGNFRSLRPFCSVMGSLSDIWQRTIPSRLVLGDSHVLPAKVCRGLSGSNSICHSKRN